MKLLEYPRLVSIWLLGFLGRKVVGLGPRWWVTRWTFGDNIFRACTPCSLFSACFGVCCGGKGFEPIISRHVVNKPMQLLNN